MTQRTSTLTDSTKTDRPLPRRILTILDPAAAAVALVGSTYALPLRYVQGTMPRVAHIITLVLLGLVLMLLLFRDDQYTARRRMTRLADFGSVAKNLALAYMVVIAASFATKGFFTGYVALSRLVILVHLFVLLGLMLASRYALWAYQTRLFREGEATRRILVVGGGGAATDLVAFLDKRQWLGVHCVGSLCVGERGDHLPTSDGRLVPLVGTVREVRTALTQTGADEVIVALDKNEAQHLPEITDLLTAAGVPYQLVPSLFEQSYRKAKLSGLAELPVVEMAVDPLDEVQRTFKRASDLAIVVTALVVGSPLLLLIALAVKLTSPGPILFRQERVGAKGRHFQMLKFRTMVQDAEARLGELEEENEAEGHIFKMKSDPRITSVGSFLRRWSLDEIPQFFNVLRGEMSVVGPRPPLPREVAEYQTPHFARLKGRPGITGLWQVSGRSDLTFDEMVKLDRHYLENWSIGLDLTILVKTIYVVFAGKGAY
ncbi:MAG: sugar transferase [Actinobacteria bacterium]|nr:sugar transferase [Actinomycetota bacterium]